MLEELRNEIHRVNRDAIDAACNGTELQKFNAAYDSSKDINSAFYKVNRELGKHRAKYDLAERVSGEKGDKQIPAEVAQDPPPPFLAHVVHHDSTMLGPTGEDNPLKGLNAEVKPTSASPSIDEEPYLGLVFHHDSTVSRIGSDYEHIPSIPLAPQPLKLLKFIHDAGKRGRTVDELVPAIVATKRILTTEKSRLNLSEIDIDLGGTGQYVVRCTKAKAL